MGLGVKLDETGKPWTQGRYEREGWRDHERFLFLPGTPLNVTIKVGEKLNPRIHPVSNVVYKLSLTHGNFSWIVSHRFKDFTMLHTKITLFRASENFRLGVTRGFSNIFPQHTIPVLPRFPGRPDTMMTSEEHIEERRAALEEYMNTLLQLNFYRESSDVVEFLNVSPFSFQHGSVKGMEGWIKKRHGDDLPWKLNRWRECLWWHDACTAHVTTSWSKRWMIVQDTFIMYVNPTTGKVKYVLLFDKNFELSVGFRKAGSRKSILLANMARNLYLKCHSTRSTKELFQYLKQTLKARPALDYIGQNQFEAYAPPRQGLATWFADGQTYMETVAQAISAAQEEIFITDWWLSPDLLLKRGQDREKWRLYKLLRSRAQNGVQISILLYKEVSAVLSINSEYSKQKLLKHPNIRVIRHPDHSPIPSMWAHHEKMVIIDQELLLSGGIDLCYGRWDTQKHRLTDIPTTRVVRQDSVENQTSPTRIVNSTRPLMEGVKSVTALLLQQHSVLDVAIGPAFQSLNLDGVPTCENTPNQDPSPESSKDFRKSARTVMLKMKTLKKLKKSKDCDTDSVKSLPSPVSDSPEHEPVPVLNQYTWPGKDYVNWIVKDVFNAHDADQDNADRLTTPRMPWHDIGVAVVGQTARDAARHFIQRWNSVKREKLKQDTRYPILVPKAYCAEINDYYAHLLKTSSSVYTQVLRSCSLWSGGQQDTEASIHTAMVESIRTAEHYVYIENQFFISFVQTSEGSEVRNGIVSALYERIMRAHRENATFRVYILIPLLPALEGDIAGDSGHGMRTIMHYQFKSISRYSTSLIQRLIMDGVENWSEYLGFYSLRGKDELNGVPVSELIYIHSKLMIVDDNRAIISSGNINDRSLLGDRDSEFGVFIKDKEFVEGTMNGKTYKCGIFSGSLRKNLFKEHLGLLDENPNQINITDPVSKEFHGQWQNIAAENTRLFEELFSVLPSDNIHTRKDSKLLQTTRRPLVETFSLTKPKLNRIQGTLVEFPLSYLKEENLQPPPLAKEGIVSSQLWT